MSLATIITFTTDFGVHDHYVGTMKGVALSICPTATLVDICHEVPSYDILQGALTVAQSYHYFPERTVHVVVVDPGVGGTRRPIIAANDRHVFVCPDNGVLSFVYERERHLTVRHVVNDRYFLHPVSNTFHGRDIFAPTAAHLSAGVPIEDFGPEVQDYVRLDIPVPKLDKAGILIAAVLKVDKFGNVVTNVTAEALDCAFGLGPRLRIEVAGAQVDTVRTSYAGAPPGQLFAIFGSMGFLEVAANQASASDLLGARVGDRVLIARR